MMKKTLQEIRAGDTVKRVLGGTVPMQLRVTEVAEDIIYCGPRGVGWKFCRRTGAEIDEENWLGPALWPDGLGDHAPGG